MAVTPAQQAAIDHTGTHLRIIACAGAGKTEVLARRVARLLTPGAVGAAVQPSEIVAFTFTDRAATELRERIRARVEALVGRVADLDGLFVGTMHAYCGEFLRRLRPEFMKAKVLTRVQQALLIDRHGRASGFCEATDLRGEPLRRHREVALYAQALDLLRESQLVPAELTGNTVARRLSDYGDLLRSRAFLDYSAVLCEAVALLESDDAARARFTGTVRHLIVDEYQDTNPVQERLVRAIADLGAEVCVVGDDDQTIYQFRGSDVRNIQTFAERYTPAKTLRLEQNFRSSEGVIALARQFAERVVERVPKAMVSAGHQAFEAGDLTAAAFECAEDEADAIAEEMTNLRGVRFTDGNASRGLDWSDMVVLCRSAKHTAPAIVQALAARQIPVVVVGMGRLFDAPEAAAARDLFLYLAGAPDVSRSTLEKSWSRAQLGVGPGRLASALDRADVIRRSVGGEPALASGRHEYHGLQRVFWKFLHRLGLREDRVARGRGEVVMYNLGRFSQVISDFEEIYFRAAIEDKYRAFAGFLRYDAENAYGEGGPAETLAAPNAVRIMTVHQAKGLEWPVVFIPGLGRNRFPSQRMGGRSVWHLIPEAAVVGQRRYEGDEDDERRLMYVAVTRSQKFVRLSWAAGDPARYRHAGAFFEEALRSKWVTESSLLAGRDRETPWPRVAATRRAVSYTDLQQYLTCPYAFKLRVVCGFNPPLHEALGYGQSLHHMLCEIHERLRRSERVEADEVPALVDRHLHLPYAYRDLETSLRTSAVEAIRRYLPSAAAGAANIVAVEQPISLYLTPTLHVHGRLDLLRRGDGGAVELVDFKTSKRRAANDSADVQLRVYAAALGEATGAYPDCVTVHDVTNGRVRTEPIDTAELARARKALANAAARLEAAAYPACGSADACDACDFRALCAVWRERRAETVRNEKTAA